MKESFAWCVIILSFMSTWWELVLTYWPSLSLFLRDTLMCTETKSLWVLTLKITAWIFRNTLERSLVKLKILINWISSTIKKSLSMTLARLCCIKKCSCRLPLKTRRLSSHKTLLSSDLLSTEDFQSLSKSTSRTNLDSLSRSNGYCCKFWTKLLTNGWRILSMWLLQFTRFLLKAQVFLMLTLLLTNLTVTSSN